MKSLHTFILILAFAAVAAHAIDRAELSVDQLTDDKASALLEANDPGSGSSWFDIKLNDVEVFLYNGKLKAEWGKRENFAGVFRREVIAVSKSAKGSKAPQFSLAIQPTYHRVKSFGMNEDAVRTKFNMAKDVSPKVAGLVRLVVGPIRIDSDSDHPENLQKALTVFIDTVREMSGSACQHGDLGDWIGQFPKKFPVRRAISLHHVIGEYNDRATKQGLALWKLKLVNPSKLRKNRAGYHWTVRCTDGSMPEQEAVEVKNVFYSIPVGSLGAIVPPDHQHFENVPTPYLSLVQAFSAEPSRSMFIASQYAAKAMVDHMTSVCQLPALSVFNAQKYRPLTDYLQYSPNPLKTTWPVLTELDSSVSTETKTEAEASPTTVASIVPGTITTTTSDPSTGTTTITTTVASSSSAAAAAAAASTTATTTLSGRLITPIVVGQTTATPVDPHIHLYPAAVDQSRIVHDHITIHHHDAPTQHNDHVVVQHLHYPSFTPSYSGAADIPVKTTPLVTLPPEVLEYYDMRGAATIFIFNSLVKFWIKAQEHNGEGSTNHYRDSLDQLPRVFVADLIRSLPSNLHKPLASCLTSRKYTGEMAWTAVAPILEAGVQNVEFKVFHQQSQPSQVTENVNFWTRYAASFAKKFKSVWLPKAKNAIRYPGETAKTYGSGLGSVNFKARKVPGCLCPLTKPDRISRNHQGRLMIMMDSRSPNSQFNRLFAPSLSLDHPNTMEQGIAALRLIDQHSVDLQAQPEALIPTTPKPAAPLADATTTTTTISKDADRLINSIPYGVIHHVADLHNEIYDSSLSHDAATDKHIRSVLDDEEFDAVDDVLLELDGY